MQVLLSHSSTLFTVSGWGWLVSRTHIFLLRIVVLPLSSSITADLSWVMGRILNTFPGKTLSVSSLLVEYLEVMILWPGTRIGGFLTRLLLLALSWFLLLSFSSFFLLPCSSSPPDWGMMGSAGFLLSPLKANLADESSPCFPSLSDGCLVELIFKIKFLHELFVSTYLSCRPPPPLRPIVDLIYCNRDFWHHYFQKNKHKINKDEKKSLCAKFYTNLLVDFLLCTQSVL